MKQAKDEATDEIEKYRQEREKQFKEFEATVSLQSPIATTTLIYLTYFLSILQHMGSREGVAARIEKDTVSRLNDMNRALATHKETVIEDILFFVYDIVPGVHKNYRQD